MFYRLFATSWNENNFKFQLIKFAYMSRIFSFHLYKFTRLIYILTFIQFKKPANYQSQ